MATDTLLHDAELAALREDTGTPTFTTGARHLPTPDADNERTDAMTANNLTGTDLPYGYRNSKGHEAVIGEYEYVSIDDHGQQVIGRAPITNPIGFQGYRQGLRFDCKASQWEGRRDRLVKTFN